MAKSQRLNLPLLAAGQAQKEVTHNEALMALDALVHGVCEGAPVNTPPSAPEAGATYICGNAPSGVWSAYAHHLACWTASGWRFIPPFEGLRVTQRFTSLEWRYRATQWECGLVDAREIRIDGSKVIGAQGATVANPTGGATVDIEARAALAAILDRLRGHGIIAP